MMRKLNLIFFAISILIFSFLNFIPPAFYSAHSLVVYAAVSVLMVVVYITTIVLLVEEPFRAWKRFITVLVFMSSGLLSEYVIYLVKTNGFSPLDWMGTVFFCVDFAYILLFSSVTFWLVFLLLKRKGVRPVN